MNSSENCRRARLPACFDPILAIVSTFRTMSSNPDQAQHARTDGVPLLGVNTRAHFDNAGTHAYWVELELVLPVEVVTTGRGVLRYAARVALPG